ncbi:LADA_0D02256g1_1 [Lachancea dasiensis]|uniref:DNA polymerase alpha subunit B n=1 Tax=Lachancea dasiensis TaxID=1072105 RepID=A0A1G4J440_9SACH|nr:LADA_0D02256g1_1 [Lachancea dasiensis]
MTQRNELVAKFGTGADEPKVLAALEDLNKIYLLDAEDLYIKWEQFAYQRSGKTTELDLDTIAIFKQNIQQQIEKKARAMGTTGALGPTSGGPPSATKGHKVLKPSGSSPSLFGFGIPKTPSLKKRRIDVTPTKENVAGHVPPSTDEKSGKFFTPSQALGVHGGIGSAVPSPILKDVEPGKTLDTLNLAEITVAEGVDLESENSLKPVRFFDAEKFKFRTMRQNLLDAADVLDDQLETFSRIVQEHYKLSAGDLGDPTIQSQSEITTVGRIVVDSPLTEGILNAESLALETSRLAGIGRRIPLDLKKVDEMSLFPGQIVALRGKNASGEFFVVEELLSIPHLNFPVSTGDDLQLSHQSMTGESTKIAVLNGPYSASNCLDFSNLAAFVERINISIKPHLVIMFGPFLDISHPLVSSGDIPDFPDLKLQPKTLDEVFTKVITPILKQIDPKIQVILIPSTLDSASNHAAYPQDSFDRKDLQLPKNFRCYTNPSTFQLNEMFIACSNVDAFKDTKEIVKGGATSSRNRFDRIAEHVLTQRRFYPLFPGGIRRRKVRNESGTDIWEHVSGADLDIPFLGLTEFVGNLTPELIIIPSELTHFARVVQNVVFVNPGTFIKPSGVRGSFAQLSIAPPDLTGGKLVKVEGEEDLYLHNVWKRCRVDIITT